jgi:hypothetical protein
MPSHEDLPTAGSNASERTQVTYFWVAVFALFAVLTTASYVTYLDDLNSCRKLCPPPNTAIVEKDTCLCAHPPVPKEK